MFPSIDSSIDSHVHTSLCNHACGEMEDYVVAAIQKGLRCLIFLEHLEIGINYFHRTWLREQDFDQYFREGNRLQKRFAHQLDIRLGVEIGFNPREIENIHYFLRQYPFSYKGLSYHYYDAGQEHLNMVSNKGHNLRKLEAIGLDTVITDYFQQILLAIDAVPCDKVCHLDAVLRHHPKARFTPDHWLLIDQLLATMAKKGILLEINTSGYEHRDAPYPAPSLIQRARQLGVGLIAGSDAHQPAQVGRFFSRLASLV